MTNTKSENLLLIFTRNPELDKCKTRLAKTVGDESALKIYKFLLDHTVSITKQLDVNKAVYYSVKVRENDIWDETIYTKYQQEGEDLGIRMQHAFEQGFKDGYKNIIIIGSDMYDMSQEDLEEAFSALKNHDAVVGPAEDGGYYLLGMKKMHPQLFQHKAWGTASVLENTLQDLGKESFGLLSQKNDIDIYEDIKNIEAFQPFLKQNTHG